jgi:GAF domain-containing protein
VSDVKHPLHDQQGFPDGDPADAYVATLERLTGLLLDDGPLETLLTQLLELTSRAISSCTAVSVTVVGDDGGYVTAASTSDDALAADAAQYELGQGPCVDSLRTGQQHHFELTEVERWPGFRDRALELGFGSVLSVPLMSGGVAIGALNIFAAESGLLAEDDVLLARRIAAPAAATLANARAYRQATRLAGQLETALANRSVIERAKGVLMVTQRCTEEEAFGLMRTASQQRNIKVVNIAEQVLRSAAG